MKFVWTDYKPTRQERRVEKARQWRANHLVPSAHAWHFWDGNNHHSRKCHLLKPRSRWDTMTYCGLTAGSELCFGEYTEHDWYMGEEPVVPTPDILCKRCRQAVRAEGSHPFRRRKANPDGE